MGSGAVRDGGEGEGAGCWRPAFGGTWNCVVWMRG